jgi:hypothetical protein
MGLGIYRLAKAGLKSNPKRYLRSRFLPGLPDAAGQLQQSGSSVAGRNFYLVTAVIAFLFVVSHSLGFLNLPVTGL